MPQSKGKVLGSPAMSEDEDPDYCPSDAPVTAAAAADAGELVVNLRGKRKANPSEDTAEKKVRAELSAAKKAHAELSDKYNALTSAVSLLINATEDNLKCGITQEIPTEPCVDSHSNQQTWNYPELMSWVVPHHSNPLTRRFTCPDDLVRLPALGSVLEKIADLSALVPGDHPAWEKLQRKSKFTSLSEQFELQSTCQFGTAEMSGEDLELLSALATEFDEPFAEKVKTYIRTMPLIKELLEGLLGRDGLDDDDKLTLAEHWKTIDKLDKYFDIVWSLAPTCAKALRLIMFDPSVTDSEKSDLLIMYEGTPTKYVCWAKMRHFAFAAEKCLNPRAKQRAKDYAIEWGSRMNTADRDLTDDEITEANNLLRRLKGEPPLVQVVSDDEDVAPVSPSYSATSPSYAPHDPEPNWQ